MMRPDKNEAGSFLKFLKMEMFVRRIQFKRSENKYKMKRERMEREKNESRKGSAANGLSCSLAEKKKRENSLVL